MSRQEKQAAPGDSKAAGAEIAVFAVARGADSRRIVAQLGALGLDCTLVDSVDRVQPSPVPAVVVLFAEGTLAGAVATQLPTLREKLLETPLVLVCAEVRPGELRSALAAGVSGLILADQVESHLRPCLEAVRSGQVCVPSSHAHQVEPATLSPREKQILGLVVMGYMNGQIAERLFVAESTVKSHLYSAFGKLGVRSRTEAVELILDEERGLGMGILALGGEPLEVTPAR